MFTDKELDALLENRDMILDQRFFENQLTGFSVHYIALRNGILIADVHGVSSGEEVQKYLALRDELVSASGWSDYAEVRQNHEDTGTTQSGRRELIRFYSNLSPACKALIYTNVSFVVRLQVKTGKLLITNKKLLVTTAKSLQDGINMALPMIEKKNNSIELPLEVSDYDDIKRTRDLFLNDNDLTNKSILIKESDFKRIMNMIQSINWDIEDEVVLEKCSVPEIEEVLEMLFIMRADIKEYVKQLNSKYDQLEAETAKRRNAEMILSERNLELTEAKNNIVSIFNTIKDGVSIIDRDGYLQDCNDAYLEMCGLDRHNLKKVNIFYSYPQEDEMRLRSYFSSLHNGKKSVCRLKRYNCNKELVHVAITSSIMQVKQSSDFFIVSIVSDISEQVKNELELISRNQQLENALSELGKSQDTLIRQEKLASLGTMVAGIAHEINNPAQAIKFSLESLKLNIADIKELAEEVLALSEMPAAQQKDGLEKLKNVVHYLDLPEIISELEQIISTNKNAVDRIENIVMSTKRMSYADANFSDSDINEIVNDALILVSNQVKYQVKIEKNLQSNIPPVYALTQELGQVIINFIINARDAIIEKGLDYKSASIGINTYYDPKKEMIVVSISDNGAGIKPEVMIKLYDPFFTTKPLGKGTGLGLNIAHRIIESHGGTISVISKVGEGTTFTINLPVRRRRTEDSS